MKNILLILIFFSFIGCSTLSISKKEIEIKNDKIKVEKMPKLLVKSGINIKKNILYSVIKEVNNENLKTSIVGGSEIIYKIEKYNYNIEKIEKRNYSHIIETKIKVVINNKTIEKDVYLEKVFYDKRNKIDEMIEKALKENFNIIFKTIKGKK